MSTSPGCAQEGGLQKPNSQHFDPSFVLGPYFDSPTSSLKMMTRGILLIALMAIFNIPNTVMILYGLLPCANGLFYWKQ